MQTKNQIKREKRERYGFGSSDTYWLQAIGSQRPELTLFINGKRFSGLLDTGTDISVITASQWLQGIGQTQNPEQSSNELYWKDEEGHVSGSEAPTKKLLFP